MSDTAQINEIQSPTVVATTIALILGQSLFCYAVAYWIGLSNSIGIDILRYLSIIELILNLPSLAVIIFLTVAVFEAISITRGMRLRETAHGWMDHTRASDLTEQQKTYFVSWFKRRDQIWAVYSFLLVLLIFVSIWLYYTHQLLHFYVTLILCARIFSLLMMMSETLSVFSLFVRSLLGLTLLFISIALFYGFLSGQMMRGNIESRILENLIHSNRIFRMYFEDSEITGCIVFHSSFMVLILDEKNKFSLHPSARLKEIFEY